MTLYSLLTVFAVVISTQASVLSPTVNILQGPSSKTTLLGPDGSIISSDTPGGSIITETSSGIQTYGAPVVVSAGADGILTAPLVSSIVASPAVLSHSFPIVAAPTSYIAAPFPIASSYGSVDTIIAGPSGTISTSRGLTASDIVAPVNVW